MLTALIHIGAECPVPVNHATSDRDLRQRLQQQLRVLQTRIRTCFVLEFRLLP